VGWRGPGHGWARAGARESAGAGLGPGVEARGQMRRSAATQIWMRRKARGWTRAEATAEEAEAKVEAEARTRLTGSERGCVVAAYLVGCRAQRRASSARAAAAGVYVWEKGTERRDTGSLVRRAWAAATHAYAWETETETATHRTGSLEHRAENGRGSLGPRAVLSERKSSPACRART
jgi:hypothetical protein